MKDHWTIRTKQSLFILAAFFCLGLVFLPSSPAHSAERYEFYNGIRSLGMGGARIAVVNDETSLVVNPAALGRLRDYYVTVVDPEIETNSNFESVLGYDYFSALSPQTILNNMRDKTGRHFHFRAQAFPSVVLPNFGIGFIGKYRINATLNEAGDEFDFDYQKDFGFIFGFNFRFFDGRVKLGFNTKIINRTEIRQTALDPNITDLDVNDTYGAEGLGIGSDIGLLLAAPVTWLPTLAIVANDVGNTKYSFRDGLFLSTTDDPVTTDMQIDVGFSVSPIVGKKTRSVFAIEYRDVLYDDTVNGEEDITRRIHVGYELNLYDAFFLRLGMNQRYWTAGIEFAFDNYQLQLASYGEEIGSLDGTTTLEDRRLAAKFAYRF